MEELANLQSATVPAEFPVTFTTAFRPPGCVITQRVITAVLRGLL